MNCVLCTMEILYSSTMVNFIFFLNSHNVSLANYIAMGRNGSCCMCSTYQKQKNKFWMHGFYLGFLLHETWIRKLSGGEKSAFFFWIDFQKFIAFCMMLSLPLSLHLSFPPFLHPSTHLSIHPSACWLKNILARNTLISESLKCFWSAEYFAVCMKLTGFSSVPINKRD